MTTVMEMKMTHEGASLLRSPRFQRHGGCQDEALLTMMWPTQSAAAVTVATAGVVG